MKNFAEGFLPLTPKDALAFGTPLFKSALFKAKKGSRAMYLKEVQVPGHPGVGVYYTGEELQQDDLRVLLTLVQLREGQLATRAIKITPRAFCAQMGRAANSDSVRTLAASLTRLQAARVRVVNSKTGAVSLYSFVSDVDMQERGQWTVWLSERLAELMQGQLTYLDKETRLGMSDGLDSWTYQLVMSDACFAPFLLADLREWSGMDTYTQAEFNRHFKQRLEKLKKMGVIEAAMYRNGKVLIKKAPAEVH